MIYNQDDEKNFLSDNRVEEMENFLSDKRVEEVEYEQESPRPRRRGGYIDAEDKPKEVVPKKVKKQEIVEEEEEEEGDDTFVNIAIVIVFVIVLLIAGFLISKILFGKGKTDTEKNETPTENIAQTNQTTKTNTNENKSTNTSTNKNTNSNSNNSSSNSQTLSTSDTYNAYPVTIESVVYKKGGNFYNNGEKITGDKVYVEYKQITGLKDTTKQAEINEMLKNKVIALYDKNYLSDKNTLFVDIHTKISVNFNTISYVIYRTGEDIDGKHILQKVESINIRLKDKSDIAFEDIFTSSSDITSVYSSYVKGKVSAYYYTPEKLYIYDDKYNETEIDLSKYADKISIFTKYKADTDIFTSTAKSQKAFSVLTGTVSDETKDRAFKQN